MTSLHILINHMSISLMACCVSFHINFQECLITCQCVICGGRIAGYFHVPANQLKLISASKMLDISKYGSAYLLF